MVDGKQRNNSFQFLFREKLLKVGDRHSGASLRQHYLDQVQRVGGAPASPSQPLSRRAGRVGSPNSLKIGCFDGRVKPMKMARNLL
jgi:hypothetical protein